MVSSDAECECVIQQTPEASKYWSGTGIVQGDLTVLVFTPVNRKGACVRTGYASKAGPAGIACNDLSSTIKRDWTDFQGSVLLSHAQICANLHKYHHDTKQLCTNGLPCQVCRSGHCNATLLGRKTTKSNGP